LVNDKDLPNTNDIMNRISKVFILGLAIVALAGFGKIGTTKAAAQPGSLIKMNGLSSVYYLGADGKRYVFPNAPVYFSWYKDFSGVVTISQSELESYPLAANITMRPGTRLVKITTNPKVYAVEPGGILRAIPDEAAAKALYGDNWNKRVSDVADAFFTNYRTGNPLAANEVPAGSLVKNAGNAAVYYFDGTNYRTIADEAAFNANRFSFDNVMTISNTITAGGTAITANEFANPDSSATGQGTQPGQGTGLTVALSTDTPASQSVPTNVPVHFTTINLTAASDGEINVSGIKITAYELGDPTKIDDVTIFDNGVKFGNAKDINSNREASFVFATPIKIAAGATKTLVIKATAATSGDYALGIAKASDITASGLTVSGSFPIIGNKMSAVVSTNVGTLEITGKPDNSTTTVDFGEDNVLLASFTLKAKNEAALLSSMKFKNGGTNVSDIVSNLKLFVDGNEVSTGNYSDGYVNFALNNVKIEKNNSVTIEVRGDIGTTNVDDTIKLYLKDRADIVATGVTYGFDLQLDTTSFEKLDTSAKGITVTLSASDFTMDADKAATPARDVKAGDNDVVLATISFRSNGENATLEEITGNNNFKIMGTGLEDEEIENVRMVDLSTGAVYDLDATFNTKLNHYDLALSDEINLVKGVTKKFAIKVDLNDETDDGDSTNGGEGIDANDTMKVYLSKNGLSVTGDISNTSITDITPSSIDGAIMTVKEASLAWNVTNMTDKTVVTGAPDVEVYAAKLKAGAADGVKLNSLKLTTLATDDTPFFTDNNITKMDLYLNGVLLKSVSNNIVEPTAGAKGTITFNSLAANTIAAGAEVNLVVKATFSSSFTNPASFKLEVASGDDITAKSVTGNKTVDITGSITGGARTITGATVGTLKVELLTTDINASQDQYILAGATNASKYAGELKFTTANEPIKVKTLTLTSLGTDTSSDINTVRLVKADGTVVASKTVESDGDVVFDPFDVVFDADKSTSLFISPLARGINVDGDAASTATQGHTIQYKLGAGAAITAQGMNSGNDITIAANADDTLSAGEWDDDSSTKTFTITGVRLITVVNAGPTEANLSSGSHKEIGRYTLTFEHGNNRLSNNDPFKAQLDKFKVTLTESAATTTDLVLKVDGTTREVADSATPGVWTATELQNPSTGLLNVAQLDDVVTLVIYGTVTVDPTANNYSVQTTISDLNGTDNNDDIQHNGLENMYLPYTSVVGTSLHNG
jgi:hypothetical protein